MLFCSSGSQKFKTTLTRLSQEASFKKKNKKNQHVFIWQIRALAVALGIFIVSCGPLHRGTDSLIAARTGPVARHTWDPSSLTKDRAQVPCIARWILSHWTTREIPKVFLEALGDNPFPRWFQFLETSSISRLMASSSTFRALSGASPNFSASDLFFCHHILL